MERINMEPKTWTMQGEVSAAKRPKNSALEVDLDFEHNARPVPQTTEESTASLEDLIKKRIVKGQFDDVQKPPSFAKAPREKKELDENKSKKGLAELYEVSVLGGSCCLRLSILNQILQTLLNQTLLPLYLIRRQFTNSLVKNTRKVSLLFFWNVMIPACF